MSMPALEPVLDARASQGRASRRAGLRPSLLLACCALGLLGIPACGSESNAGPNHCEQDADCDEGRLCSQRSKLCFLPRARTPYTLVLQVARLPGGERRLTRFTAPVGELTRSDEAYDLRIPKAVYVSGQVRGRDEIEKKDVMINAELAFIPIEKLQGLPAATVVVESRGLREVRSENYRAALAPNTRYLVRAIPLGEEGSRAFPPYQTELQTGRDDVVLDLRYEDLATVTATLVDQAGTPWGGARVRIVDRVSGNVLSSTTATATADNEENRPVGEFTLTVARELLTSSGYAYEVDPSPNKPFQTRIRIDPSYLLSTTRQLSMPTLPAAVTFYGRVEHAGKNGSPAQANLIFRSRFVLPDTAGNVGDRDFCRSRLPDDTRPSFECEATVQAVSDVRGVFSVALLPGDYDVYVSPNADSQHQERSTTVASRAVIETQPKGGAQRGQTFILPRGALYRGRVRNDGGEPLRNIIVRAEALQLVGYLGEVAAYNRSTETVSDAQGDFELAVDTGFYDLVARPSEAYPWMYVPNRAIARGAGTIDISGFVLQPPVVLAGQVTSAGVVAPGAEIDAYAVIGSLSSGKRSVLIGRTTSDETGHYTLLLPDEIVSLETEPAR